MGVYMKTNVFRSGIAQAIFAGLTLCLASGFSVQAKAVIGGEPASGDLSFMGLIVGAGEDVSTRDGGCSAVFVSDSWAVTSGNCLLQYYTGRYPIPVNGGGSFALSNEVLDIEFIFGDNDVTGDAVTRVVPAQVVFHPGFLLASNAYTPTAPDLALVALTEKANTQAVAMAEPGTLEKALKNNSPATILGWGASDELALEDWDWMSKSPRGTVLTEASLHIDERCGSDIIDETTPEWISAMTFCASDAQEVADYCGGDAGGPLLVNDPVTGSPVLAGINLNLKEDCLGGLQTSALAIESVSAWIKSTIDTDAVAVTVPEVQGEIEAKCWEQFCKFSASALHFDGVAPVDVVWTMTHRSQERTYAKSFSGMRMESWVHPGQVYDISVRARTTNGLYAVHNTVLDLNVVEFEDLAPMSGDFAVSCDGLKCKYDASAVNFGGIKLHSVIWYPLGMRNDVESRGMSTTYEYSKSDVYTVEVVGFDPNGNLVQLMGGVSVSNVEGTPGTMFITQAGSLGTKKRVYLPDAEGIESKPGRIKATFYTSSDDAVVLVQYYDPENGWTTIKEKAPVDGRVRVNHRVKEIGLYRYRMRRNNEGLNYIMHYLVPK